MLSEGVGLKKKKRVVLLVLLLLLSLVVVGFVSLEARRGSEKSNTEDLAVVSAEKVVEKGMIKLPQPSHTGSVSLEETIFKRRSVREYGSDPLSLKEVSQLLWAALGETTEGRKTVPSAGALYPLELYLVVRLVEGLEAGTYKYLSEGHALRRVAEGDRMERLVQAAVSQTWIGGAPAVLVFGAVYERTTVKYGERGVKYVYMEVGHAAQNVYLQAVSLGLGTVVVGAFDDERVRQLVGMEKDERPLYLMPVGRK